jgi:exodeoxyribonuclease X
MIIRCIDLETAGLKPPAGVCEVATVDLIVHQTDDRQVATRGHMWNSLTNPEHPIPADASGIHNITDAMVKDAPAFGELIDKVCAPTHSGAPDAFCAHNSKFDRQWFNPPNAKWLDTYKLALWIWPESPNHTLGCLEYYLHLKFSDDAGPRHRALGDAYRCAAILRKAFQMGATFDQMAEVSANPAVLPRILFGKHAMKPFTELPADYLDWICGQKDMDEDVRYTARIELGRRKTEV